jgi:hypothetical protein
MRFKVKPRRRNCTIKRCFSGAVMKRPCPSGSRRQGRYNNSHLSNTHHYQLKVASCIATRPNSVIARSYNLLLPRIEIADDAVTFDARQARGGLSA